MQFAARQRRLQQVRGVHGAVRLARADQRVHLVDEQNDLAVRTGNFVQYGFQTLFEFAAIFRPGDERAHVERQQRFFLQAFRHVAIDDAQRQSFRDGGLADAGLADEDGIVFRSAREDLHSAADFLVAADHGIELAVACGFGEVAGIALQRVIGLLGRRGVGGAALADVVDRLIEFRRGDA